ncbi:MAG TPA: RNA methyltransferase substrate-binding domain-containing protein, partial [Rhodospirillales bacterium]|nr:RNA methyltransferase substrate-binding domain-containing protein [Rhodospirillales bacterium]
MRRRKHRPEAAAKPAQPGQPPRRARAATAVPGAARATASAGAAGGYWLWGRHAVLAAVANSRRRLDRLLAGEETAAELQAAAAATGLRRPPVERLDRRELAALLPADAVHQGFAAAARPLPAADLADLL